MHPGAHGLDWEAKLARVAHLVSNGTSAERQLRFYDQAGGAAAESSALLITVIDSYVADFKAGIGKSEN